jgi:O-succinylbenzoate synthase
MSFRLSYRRYSLGFKQPVRTAHGIWSRREGFILRVDASDGYSGYGEIAPIPWFGTETVEQAEEILSGLNGSVDPQIIAGLGNAHPCTAGGLRAAIEGATDAGRMTEAGKSGDFLQVAGLLPAGEACLAKARALSNFGFRTFKWKVGVLAADDERALLDDLLAVLPEGSRLRLDANGAWDRRKAELWLSCCADRPIEHVEQPVAPSSRAAEDVLLGLQTDYPTPIALDESLVNDADLDHWAALDWKGVYVVKPLLLADARGRCRFLEKANARVVFSSALETGIGAQHVLALAFAWKGERRALGMGVWPLFADSRFDGPSLSPFIRLDEMKAYNPELTWNVLS